MANKRGRKRKEEPYFGLDEEEAVIKFLACEDLTERNEIYNEWLRAPLNKMIDSIIRRYKLYRKGETFEDLHADTLSFLMTKAHKFEGARGSKAYSYYGTICKRYILGLLIKDEKYMRQTDSYEDRSEEIEQREDQLYTIDDDNKFSLNKFITKISDSIKKDLNNETNTGKRKINDNERKVGYALIELLDNWETSLDSMDGGAKYNKNSILETMRNYTLLSTKDIRLGMKRYKELYDFLKQSGLENGFD